MKTIGYLTILIAALLLGTAAPLLGQADETIITIAVPEWQRQNYSQAIFEDFYAEHPGVKVVIVTEDMNNNYYFFDGNEESMERNLEAIAARASSADIIVAQNYNFTIEATRTGAFLDLAPLVEGDADFDTTDFYPAAWESFQWDRGIWAIPLGVSAELMIYNPAAFDEAGLNYPNPNWTVEDLANAASTLTTYDEEGEVTIPGFTTYEPRSLIVSLAGHPLIDRSILPNEPNLNTPELANVLEVWQQMAADQTLISFGSFDTTDVPMAVDRTWRIGNNFAGDNVDWAFTLFPGGGAGLAIEALAVSAGTQNPELAYEVIKYLTTAPEATSQSFSVDYPARRSMVGVEGESESFRAPLPDEAREAIELALENAIPHSDTQFFNYISPLTQAFGGNEDIQVSGPGTLEEAQQTAVDTLASLSGVMMDSAQIAVVVPEPTPMIAAGQSVLKFRLQVPFSPLPNQEAWDTYIREFVASEPNVGNIDVLSGFSPGPNPETPDCWYAQGGVNLGNMDTSTILALDPFLDADPNFDESDVLPGVMQQVQRDNQTWAYPISLQPTIMTFDRGIFEREGIPTPDDGWTVEEFVQTLRDLGSSGNYDYVFYPQMGSISYIAALSAAFGGPLADYSTTPYEFNLDDPATVEAVKQVLDLAKDDLMQYQELGNLGGGGGFGGGEVPVSLTSFTSLLFDISFQRDNPDIGINNTRGYVAFPEGSQYAPISYSVGLGFIGAESQDPEACYRLLSGIAERPELLTGMPARQSQINDPALVDVVGEDVARVYTQFGERLNAPNVFVVPDEFASTFSNFIEQTWVGRAFDRYVLEDGDLNVELEEALLRMSEYRECVGPEVEPDVQNMTQEEIQEFFQRYTTCAVDVDPSLEGRFGGGGGDSDDDDE